MIPPVLPPERNGCAAASGGEFRSSQGRQGVGFGVWPNSSHTSFLAEEQRLWGIPQAATSDSALCAPGMTSSLNKGVWGAHNQFLNAAEGEIKVKSLPPLAYCSTSAHIFVTCSSAAGRREEQRLFKCFQGAAASPCLEWLGGRGLCMATYLELPNHGRMPTLGLGTWQVPAGAGDLSLSLCLWSCRWHQGIAENRGRCFQQSHLRVRKVQQILFGAFLAFWNISGDVDIHTCPSGNFLSEQVVLT